MKAVDENLFSDSYEKMPDSLQKTGLGESDFSALEKVKWVVTEKVHGANFSFIYEGGALKFAKRKNLLAWNESFFGYQLVAERIEEQVLQLFEDLQLSYASDKFILHGELFGGKYPHADVKAIAEIQPVQTGVYYAPDIEFCAFDIAVFPKGSASKMYLDYETAVQYLEKHGILYARPLFIGKLNEAVNFQTRINSTIPELLHLPALADNLIEGVVVKPYEAYDQEKIPNRPVLKIKNEEFKEEKFHDAQKWDYYSDIKSKSGELSFVAQELKNYVNENRLNSAVSKIGTLDSNNPERITEIETEMFNDCVADFNADTNGILHLFDAEQQQWIENRLKAEIRLLLKMVLQQ